MTRRPQRGEIWLADLNPPTGHEQAGPPRPVLIVSGRAMNLAPYDLSLIVPLTSHLRGVPGHIFVAAPDSGLNQDSEILCEHCRSISHRRFRSQGPLGRVASGTMNEVIQQIHLLMQP